jgi:lipopolysaccharide/colanic/teichoic acid biosynthesis glycosyltransferase
MTRAGYYLVKRLVDIILAAASIVLLISLLPLVAIAIKVDSPGPVFFNQQRIRGRRVARADGATWTIEPFTLYKFRTMRNDADPSLHRRYMTAYLSGDEAQLSALRPGRRCGESYRPMNDPRVTRVGVWLRKLSIDELPQLWNVLKGDMSLVGPRPPLRYEVDLYDRHHLARLATPCGLTGLAQVKGRSAIGWEDMVRWDLDYIARQSLWLDLKILLSTLPVVLSANGAD